MGLSVTEQTSEQHTKSNAIPFELFAVSRFQLNQQPRGHFNLSDLLCIFSLLYIKHRLCLIYAPPCLCATCWAVIHHSSKLTEHHLLCFFMEGRLKKENKYKICKTKKSRMWSKVEKPMGQKDRRSVCCIPGENSVNIERTIMFE